MKAKISVWKLQLLVSGIILLVKLFVNPGISWMLVLSPIWAFALIWIIGVIISSIMLTVKVYREEDNKNEI